MKVTLNKEKHGMVFIDGLEPLTFDQPGPLDVDVDKVSSATFNQLSYNLLRGAIIVDKPEELNHYAKQIHTESITPETISSNEAPITPKKINEIMQEQVVGLKKLLNKTIPTIKKSVPALKANEVKKLLKLEKKGKNRKSLVEFLTEANTAHVNAVNSQVGDTEFVPSSDPNLIKGGLDLNQYSKNITNVVDSEVEQVTIKLTTDED